MGSAASIAKDATTQLLGHLRELGLSARLADHRPLVKRLGSSLFGTEAHGFIDIAQGPINWINVAVWIGHASSPDEFRKHIYTRYGVPDDRLRARHRPFKMWLSRQRSIPFIGEVRELIWRGNRAAKGIAGLLNEDEHTRAVLLANMTIFDMMAHSPNPVWINAVAPYPFWLICTQFPFKIRFPSWEACDLTNVSWGCYVKLATTLLDNPLWR